MQQEELMKHTAVVSPANASHDYGSHGCPHGAEAEEKTNRVRHSLSTLNSWEDLGAVYVGRCLSVPIGMPTAILTDVYAPGEESNIHEKHRNTGSLSNTIGSATVYSHHGSVHGERRDDTNLDDELHSSLLHCTHQADQICFSPPETVKYKATGTIAESAKRHEACEY